MLYHLIFKILIPSLSPYDISTFMTFFSSRHKVKYGKTVPFTCNEPIGLSWFFGCLEGSGIKGSGTAKLNIFIKGYKTK